MSLVQQLARAHRERRDRLHPVSPVRYFKPQEEVVRPILKANRHEYWPNKIAPPRPRPLLTPDGWVREEQRFPKIKEIQLAVCKRKGVELIDLISERRTQHLVRPRQLAMYLCRKLTPHGYPEIGRRFGGRDHTTVMWAVRKTEWRMEIDDEVVTDIAALTAQLGGGC